MSEKIEPMEIESLLKPEITRDKIIEAVGKILDGVTFTVYGEGETSRQPFKDYIAIELLKELGL